MWRLRKAIVVGGWIALLFVMSLGIADAVLAPTPAAKQPDFIDTILTSRAVVAALRIAIIFAVVFIVLSVIALIARGQWLTRLGPVEVSSGTSDLEAENQRHKEDLETAHQVIDAWKGVVASTHQLIDKE